MFPQSVSRSRLTSAKFRKIAAMETFAARLQAALDERNWKPNDLSAKVKVSDDTIRKWLDPRNPRQPKLADALEVSRVLGLSLDYLADGESGDPLSPEKRRLLDLASLIGFDEAYTVLQSGVRRAVKKATSDLPAGYDSRESGPVPIREEKPKRSGG